MWWYHIANPTSHYVAAKAALRRKKAHERSLEQTRAQVMQIEQQIYSIEAANINQETLNAMKNAGSAMQQIHGGLTIDKVDATMYVPFSSFLPLDCVYWFLLPSVHYQPLESVTDTLSLAGTNFVNS